MYVQKVRLRANKVMLILYSCRDSCVYMCVYRFVTRSILLQFVDLDRHTVTHAYI